MTDEKAVFIEDLREKKELKRSAKHKTGKGAKQGKAFKQPSEHWKTNRKKNGDIMSYSMGIISWAEFRSYPVNIQKEYIQKHVDEFGMTKPMMANMLDTTVCAISSYIYHRPELKGTLRKNSDPKMIVAFDHWLKSQRGKTETKKLEVEKEPVKVETPYFVDTIQLGHMELRGTASQIFQTLYSIFRDAKLNVELNFEVCDAEPVVEPEPEPELEQVV